MLTLALSNDYGPFGWGVCSKNLVDELASKATVTVAKNDLGRVKGKVFHTIADITFKPFFNILGDYNAGYCFFELDLMRESIVRAKSFDHIFCGSTYNMIMLDRCDIYHTSLLIQGVDHDIFNPSERTSSNGKFTIFSGGKFEYRKGQDLVVAAFKALMDKYKDLHLVTMWENKWNSSLETMTHSPHLKLNLWGESWQQRMKSFSEANELPLERVTHYPMCTQRKVSDVMADTDLGVFPNRCEGGTNLVLMEYMAKQRPVVASYNSGHVDIVNEDNALLLKEQKVHSFLPYNRNELKANWWEPDLDELIAHIEWAYLHRDELEKYGKAALKSIEPFTWDKSADVVLKHILNPEIDAVDYLPHRQVLGDLLTKLGYSGEGAEIGVFGGGLSRFIYSRWLGKKLHLIDRWEEVPGWRDICNKPQEQQDKLYETVKFIFKDADDVIIHRMPSLEAVKKFKDGQLDWVYIDADHTYKAIRDDLEAWVPKVRIGGLVSGDDYLDGVTDVGVFGVKSAVDEFVYNNKYDLKLSADLRNPNRSWYFIKDH